MARTKTNFRDQVVKDAERQQREASSYGHLLLPKGISVFSPDPGGRVKLDFIPYEVTDPKHPDRDNESGRATPGSLWYKHPYKLHRSIGTNNDSYVCLTSIGKKCPICEQRAKLIRENAPKEDTDPLRPSLRNLYIVIPLDSKKHEVEPHIFDISQYLFQKLLNEELEENRDNGIFPDLEEGLTLKVRFDASTIGSGKPFAEASRIDFLEREEQYDEGILDEVPNLDKVLKVLTYDELNNIYFDLSDEEDGGKLSPFKETKNDEEDEPEPPKRTRNVHQHPKVEEEPEEEEPEPPKRTRQTRGSYSGDYNKKEEETVAPPPTRTRTAQPKKDQCPYSHVFGVDTNKFDDCDTCVLWDACTEAKEKN